MSQQNRKFQATSSPSSRSNISAELNYSDRTDFDNAERGFIAHLEPGQVYASDGRQVYDADIYAQATQGECPSTVNPSLWRQSQLTAIQGLFEVTRGIYQLRGIDLSNMTVVEGDTGVVIIDPAVSEEVSAAGLALYTRHRGNRPVTGVIFTHSHIDHFGGVSGVLAPDSEVPVVAPKGFLEHAVSENVYAGTAMLRRSLYHTGAALPVGAEGTLGVGLGSGTSYGTSGLVAPTIDITHTGQEVTLDGVLIRFQVTPGTEAPAEMNFIFPQHRALCLAENATHNLHNILTLRGAEVRDARNWSRYLSEAIEMFIDETDVAFASHHWPTWGKANVVSFLSEQRDLYAFLHDQTLRLMNKGFVASEIAEDFPLPPALESAWHARGYYGSVNHNVKAIYQRYIGWYDGNPAHLWQHPPEASARRYVDTIGGLEATVRKARAYADEGDLRFAAELNNHAVFADPDYQPAIELQARVLTELGHGAECATWRNNYLTGAQEFAEPYKGATFIDTSGLMSALTVTQVFDSLAIRIDAPKAWATHCSLRWSFTDQEQDYHMELTNGVLIHYPTRKKVPVDLVVTLTKPGLAALVAGREDPDVTFEGDAGVWQKIISLTDDPDPKFNVITP